MNRTLTIAACNFLIPELAQVIQNGDYPDVKLVSFPANCAANPKNQNTFQNIISNAELNNSDLILLSSTCNTINYSNETNSTIQNVTLKQCFEVLINPDTILHFISKGYYIASNGWLRSYDQHILNWGFEKDAASKFFTESMKGILFLDTKIPGDYITNLNALSKYMNLPYEILPIGLTYCKMYIDSLVLNWRNEKERKTLDKRISSISKQSADYSVIFNQLEMLVNLTDENEIINAGFQLVNILFAPSSAKYSKYSINNTDYFEFEGISMPQPSNANNELVLDIYYANDFLGKFEMVGIKFPQFMSQYKAMAKIIGQILGISIANARKYKVILKQKDLIENYSIELQKTNNSKDKFFSIIAHDLKSPFNSLLGFSELLNDEINEGNNANVEKYVSFIHKTLNDTFNLLVNLLEWAQSQLERIEFKPELIQLFETTHEIVNLLASQAEKKGIDLEINIPKETQIFADKNMLNTILRNLVSNAIKYVKNNGKVIISSSAITDYTQICVRDTGIGMTPKNLEKLFSLETTESKPGTSGEKGTGLGLLLCKEFVEKHGGKIWAESEFGNGSKFTFTIPQE